MLDPSEVAAPNPGPQGFENNSAPLQDKRKLPWVKIIIGGAVLFFVLRLAGCFKTSETQGGNNADTPRPSILSGYSSSSGPGFNGDEIQAPKLLSILGTEATFIYAGAHYRLPNGTGPIGGDWFCGLLDGSVATIYNASGDSFRIGVDRTYSAAVRRSAGGQNGADTGKIGSSN